MTYSISDARLSPCQRYRYSLSRVWNLRLPVCVWIGLNPSTADASEDDPTIRRMVDFSRSWEFGGIQVVNLFDFRATDPKELNRTNAPHGPGHNWHCEQAIKGAERVVVAWGSGSAVDDVLFERGRGLMASLIRRYPPRELVTLNVTGNGQPGHPLYLPKSVKPLPYVLET